MKDKQTTKPIPSPSTTYYADCDCDTQLPNDVYVCEECEGDVTICDSCHTIISACGCGHCPEGATFHESD